MTDAPSGNLERAKRILDENPSIDFHSHMGLWESKGLPALGELGSYPGDDVIRTHAERMIASGCKSASINLTSDVPIIAFGRPGNKSRDYGPGEAWAEYQRLWGILKSMLDTMPLAVAEDTGDIARINDAGKLAVFLSVEGAHMVEDDLQRLETLRKDGVRKFQPMHYAVTKIGDNQTDPEVFGGLSELGRRSVQKARSLGMVIDVAHATEKATAAMAEASGGPVVLSHTLMKYDSPKWGPGSERNPRWISRDHARMIAETGGMIGTWAVHSPLGAGSAGEFVEAVMTMIETAGIEHVGWSTDLIHAGMGPWFRDYRDFPALMAGFLDAGMSDDDLKLFIGGNALRIQEEALAASAVAA